MTEKTSSRGLFDSLTNLLATLVAIVHTRLELLSTELEEDREHLLSLLTTMLSALFCLGVGTVLAVILLVVAFWDTHRLLVLVSLTGLFLVVGLTLWMVAMHKARTKPRVFASSLLELLKDQQKITSNL